MASSSPAAPREGSSRWLTDDRVIAAILAVLLLIAYAATAQVHINGSRSPYATDVGEIQNALPRWGTLHFTGYPQYSLLGSAFVSLLRLLGLPPSLGASLYSAVWGALTAALTYGLARELGASRIGAAGATLIAGLALSIWMDASLAEVHTMTMALTVGALWAALRFLRRGDRSSLLWLAALFTQGVVHQRAVAFIAPALLVLVWGRWRMIWRNAGWIVLLGLTALATYLYLPLRAWLGADWTFNSPGTWRGFWGLVLDTKSERIVRLPTTLADASERGRNILSLLRQDLPLWLLVLGLLGVGLLAWRKRGREALALALIVAVHVALAIVIWEGRISDALLAVKLPVVWTCALGLAFLSPRTARGWQSLAIAAVTLALALLLGWRHAPQVLAVTRDRSSEPLVRRLAPLAPPTQATVVWLPWGHDYWALTYAQRYRGELPGLTLVDHNAPVDGIVAAGQLLITPQETFYVFAPDWWRERLRGLALSSAGEGLVTVSATPQLATPTPHDAVPLNDELAVAAAAIAWRDRATLSVQVRWLALAAPSADFSVGVHLLGRQGEAEDVALLAQADAQHPVYGWYPTTQWATNEIVSDDYLLAVPPGSRPQEVRLFMYTHDDAGFYNTEAVTIPVPAPPD